MSARNPKRFTNMPMGVLEIASSSTVQQAHETPAKHKRQTLYIASKARRKQAEKSRRRNRK